MNQHGYSRFTVDMDGWIDNSPGYAAKMVEVIKKFGVDVPDLSVDLFIDPGGIARFAP